MSSLAPKNTETPKPIHVHRVVNTQPTAPLNPVTKVLLPSDGQFPPPSNLYSSPQKHKAMDVIDIDEQTDNLTLAPIRSNS